MKNDEMWCSHDGLMWNEMKKLEPALAYAEDVARLLGARYPELPAVELATQLISDHVGNCGKWRMSDGREAWMGGSSAFDRAILRVTMAVLEGREKR